MSPAELAPLVGLLFGSAFGVIVHRTHYCVMGAIADFVLFGSTRRLRSWALAVAVSLLGVQLAAASGLVALEESRYLQPPIFWLGALLGGLLFGFGMVLTGGCISRNLVRAGAGSLKAWLVLLLVGISAYATMAGVLAPLTVALRRWGSIDPGFASVPDIFGFRHPLIRLAPALVLFLCLSGWAFADRTFRRPSAELWAGLLLGLIIIGGWLATGWLLADPFDPRPVTSLSFVAPTGRTLLYVMAGGGTLPDFTVALVLGTLLGAGLSARAQGGLRTESFVDRSDFRRHVTGSLLMGVGGVLAGGCTVGQGLSGLSTLSLNSVLAVAAIVAGAIRGVRYLETGRIIGVAGKAGFPRRTTSSNPNERNELHETS